MKPLVRLARSFIFVTKICGIGQCPATDSDEVVLESRIAATVKMDTDFLKYLQCLEPYEFCKIRI